MAENPYSNLIAIAPDGTRQAVGVLADWCKARFGDDYKTFYEGARKAVMEDRPYKGWRFVQVIEEKPPEFDTTAPPKVVREQLRRYIAWVANKDAYYAAYADERPPGWNGVNLLKVAEQVAKSNNIDWGDVGDTRDAEDKALDAAMQFVRSPDDVFAMTEEVIAAIEKGMERIRTGAADVWKMLDDQAKEYGIPEPPGPKRMAEQAARWLDLFRRLKSARRLAREAYLPELADTYPERHQRSTHQVRFMLYTGRSDITGIRPADDVYKIGLPQVRMSVEPWLAEHGYDLYPGVGLRGPDDERGVTGKKYPFVRWVGVLIMAPPRHSKTDTVLLRRVLRMDLNPKRQAAYIHDNDDFASSRLVAVRQYFDPKTIQGRRNLSLFPDRALGKGNNANNLTLASDSPTTSPSLVAHGIATSKTGINLDDLDGDDLVPPSDIHQPTERQRRVEVWDRTWMTRFQGTGGFLHMTGYPQHQDDLLSLYEKRAYLCRDTNGDEGIKVWVCKMPVGGPDTDPPFYAIMPELYDEHFLRQKWASLTDKTTWASNYMMRPLDERDQLVRRLRLYDQHSDEHKEFMQTAELYVGLDPAAKGDGTGDKAGLVIVALGDVVKTIEKPGFGEVVMSETQIRLLEATEFHANTNEMNTHLLMLGRMMNIQRVFVEIVGELGHSTKNTLEAYHGVSAVETVGTGNKDKGTRLRAVSGLLEDYNPSFPAKVLFPAKTVRRGLDDHLAMDERVGTLADYVLNYATTSGHHSLDAFTMVLRKLMHRVDVGMGAFSQEVARDVVQGNPRVRDMLERKQRERISRHSASVRRMTLSQGA